MAAQTMTTLSVSYRLTPPEGTSAPPSLAPSAAHTFAVESDKTGAVGTYYESVRKSIAAAREKLGEELTAWRDAVGNAELGKEKAAKTARAEDDEGEEEDEQAQTV